MRICMVSSEAVPFSKSGGLADVVSSLSTALTAMGNDVRVILPCYGSIDIKSFDASAITLRIPIKGSVESVPILQSLSQGVTFYFLAHPWFTQRKGIYGDTSFTPYADNFYRFTLFAKAVGELCTALEWKPDIIHCHDWTAGLVPFLIDQDTSGFLTHTKTVFTIHNLAYQGDFSKWELLMAAIPVDERMLSGSGANLRMNMLKTGIEFADTITTVSPTYAQEIQQPALGCGLDSLLRQRSASLFGILNGIDLDEWNPQSDALLDMHFSPDNHTNKRLLKKQAQKVFRLPQDDSVALIGMVSRIAQQKGFVELCKGSPSVLERILTTLPVQVLIIGTGDDQIEQKLLKLAQEHGNLSINTIFSNKAAHLVEAGSDFFFMPSRYEPCGLNQMYSLRYGTVPIARRTGGLADSIVDLDACGENGTGFLFDELTDPSIFNAVHRAVTLYNEQGQKLFAIRKRGMEVDFSWGHSAGEYMKIYNGTKKG